MKEKFDNILLIASVGQNVGKTTLACQILKNEKVKNPVAVKITPHFHKKTNGLVEIEKGENWVLLEETDKTTKKDSSLYLQNGSAKSYLILAVDSGLKAAFSAINKILPKEKPVVIESASLINIIEPGFFVVVVPDGDCKKKEMESLLKKADVIVISNGKQFYPSPEKIKYNSSWLIK